MDCEEVKQILDAYALGAVEKVEAQGLEEHVAECVRCWEELTEAQRVAAALALGVPLHAASGSLRQRVLAAASGRRGGLPLADLLKGLRAMWPVGAGAVAAVATATVVLLAVLFFQVDDLRQDNDRLQLQLADASQVTDQLRQIEAVRSAPDVTSVLLASTMAASPAVATFFWSRSTGTGALVCNNLKTLDPSQVYQIWLFEDGEAISVGTFDSWQGVGHGVLDLRSLATEDIDGIGVSIEPEGGSEAPSGEMIFRGAFPHDY